MADNAPTDTTPQFWQDGPTGKPVMVAPPAAAPASPFFKDGPKPAAAPQTEFWHDGPKVIGQGGTEQQARQFGEEMIKHGHMTKDQATEALVAGGNEPAPVDSRGEEAKAFDATWAAPAAPEGYKLDYMNRLPPGTQTPTVSLFNTAATAWLHEVQMPAGVGTALVERALEQGQRAQRMSAPQRELWKREQAVAFDRVAKTPARAAELRAYADKVLAMQTKSPEFSAGLLKSGARFDATVLMNLALHGERLALREKLR